MGTIAQDLTTDASISYNGYTFSPAANVLKVSHKPILDQAGRTITHTVHTLVLEDILQATDQLDGTKVDTTTIRQQLNVTGGQLVVQGVGIGLFGVNRGKGISALDCMWGPRPLELTWENYGNGKAGKITWQVQCATPEQCANPAYKTQVMAYNYDATFTKDDSGYGKTIVSGYIEIPITRTQQNNRVPPDNVDRLRESCYPAVPVGWKRTNDSWKVSMDRRRGDFSYSDEEQPPNAPAEHVVKCEETHSVKSNGTGFFEWSATLSGTYEMTRARQRSEAWLHFTKFCQSRIEALQKVKNVTPILPRNLQMEEPIHSRTSGSFRLDITYIIQPQDKEHPDGQVFVQGLDRALANSGLYAVLGESNYNNWQKSMTDDGVFTARGPANTSFAGKDLIIDLCLTQPTPTFLQKAIAVSGGSVGRSQPKIAFPTPTPAGSMMAYFIGIQVEDVDLITELKPLTTQTLQNTTKALSATDTGGYKEVYPNTPASVFQNRAGTSVAVTLVGTALRAGYNITPPAIISVGGQAAVRANRAGNFFKTAIVAHYGIPIVRASWSQRFLLPAPPTSGFGAPDNPLMGRVSQQQQLFRQR